MRWAAFSHCEGNKVPRVQFTAEGQEVLTVKDTYLQLEQPCLMCIECGCSRQGACLHMQTNNLLHFVTALLLPPVPISDHPRAHLGGAAHWGADSRGNDDVLCSM